MKRFHDDFPELLKGFNLDTLEREPNPVYGLAADLTLVYLNPGWFVFAEENGGEPAISECFSLGTHIGSAMAGPAREYYLERFENVLQTGTVWHHDYQCSSPEKFRLYHQSVYPLLNRRGLIVINSLVNEQPHEPVSQGEGGVFRDLYTQLSGIIAQCSNCRRVQRRFQRNVWDWVPQWVAHVPEKTSYTFCDFCFQYYYESRFRHDENEGGGRTCDTVTNHSPEEGVDGSPAKTGMAAEEDHPLSS
jgi:hypothetical protein